VVAWNSWILERGAMSTRTVLAVFGALGGSMAAHAQSATYDFTGSGEVCIAPEPGMDYVCELQTFTGAVTIDVLAPAPTPPDGETDGSTYAFDDTDWVQSHFAIQWDGGSFEPAPLPDSSEALFGANVNNDFLERPDSDFTDLLRNGETYFSDQASCQRQAIMERLTTDTSWLTDVSFNLAVGLAPGSQAANSIYFENQAFDCDQQPIFYGLINLSSLTARVTTVDIDIKPGSDPNSINPRSKGVIPVAVLGSGDFDAMQVDAATVGFGPGAAPPKRAGQVTDVNGDGFVDVVFHFRTQNAALACGDTRATLTGETFSGDAISGTDALKTAGCGKRTGD
jgi:hypothetical protein